MICGNSHDQTLTVCIAERFNVQSQYGHPKYTKNVNAYVTNIEKS